MTKSTDSYPSTGHEHAVTRTSTATARIMTMTLIAERISTEITMATWLTRFQVVCQAATMRMLPPVELYRQVSHIAPASKPTKNLITCTAPNSKR